MSTKKRVVFRDMDGNKVYSISIDKVKKSLKTAGAADSLVVVMLIAGTMNTVDLQDQQKEEQLFNESQAKHVTEMQIEEEQAKAEEEVKIDEYAKGQAQIDEENAEVAEDFLNSVEEDNSQEDVPSRVGP